MLLGLLTFFGILAILWNSGYKKTVLSLLFFSALLFFWVLAVLASAAASMLFEDFEHIRTWAMPNMWSSLLISSELSLGFIVMLLPFSAIADILRLTFSFVFTTPLIAPKVFALWYAWIAYKHGIILFSAFVPRRRYNNVNDNTVIDLE